VSFGVSIHVCPRAADADAAKLLLAPHPYSLDILDSMPPKRPKSSPSCVIRRTLSGPPHVVYRVWTEPEYAAMWSWGRAYETVSVEIDKRVGGKWRQQVRDKKTGELWSFEGDFLELVPDRRLAQTFHWVSDRGVDDGKSQVSVDFVDRGDKTEVVITHTDLPNEKEKKAAENGWEDVLDCIDKTIPVATEDARPGRRSSASRER
jgi:uncharacterized protein YndB with AHSA1/START domain